MKTPFKLLYGIVLITAVSCSSVEDALLPADNSIPDILQELSQSNWQLSECPENQFLTLNGQSECEYLSNLSFDDERVIITYSNGLYKIPHYICYVQGDNLVVSIQECANTTWRSLFEWKVVARNSDTLIMDVRVPNLSPGYAQRFTFKKVN